MVEENDVLCYAWKRCEETSFQHVTVKSIHPERVIIIICEQRGREISSRVNEIADSMANNSPLASDPVWWPCRSPRGCSWALDYAEFSSCWRTRWAAGTQVSQCADLIRMEFNENFFQLSWVIHANLTYFEVNSTIQAEQFQQSIGCLLMCPAALLTILFGRLVPFLKVQFWLVDLCNVHDGLCWARQSHNSNATPVVIVVVKAHSCSSDTAAHQAVLENATEHDLI